MTPDQRFDFLLEEYDRTREAKITVGVSINAECEQAVVESASAKRPLKLRRGQDAWTVARSILTAEEYNTIFDAFTKLSTDKFDALKLAEDAFTRALLLIADGATFSDPAQRTEWREWKSIYGYHSAGLHYGAKVAQWWAYVATHYYGVQARSAASGHGGGVCEVFATARDVRLMEFRVAWSLRDEVQWLLQHGCDPRVIHPFLPWGYEERVGLDAFGNDVPKQPDATLTPR